MCRLRLLENGRKSYTKTNSSLLSISTISPLFWIPFNAWKFIKGNHWTRLCLFNGDQVNRMKWNVYIITHKNRPKNGKKFPYSNNVIFPIFLSDKADKILRELFVSPKKKSETEGRCYEEDWMECFIHDCQCVTMMIPKHCLK